MNIFNCDHCGHPIFFENVQCLNCGSTRAFLPDQLTMVSLQPTTRPGIWERRSVVESALLQYRMCLNRQIHQTCNFAVAFDDAQELCLSCWQTRVLPDLSIVDNLRRWCQIEVAKRRLFFSLARLGLVSTNDAQGSTGGPVYEFLADLPGGPRVMTGHNEGLITLNIAEADDDERA